MHEYRFLDHTSQDDHRTFQNQISALFGSCTVGKALASSVCECETSIRTHRTYPCFWWDRAAKILPRNVVVLRCKPTPHLVKLVERQQQGRRGQRRSRGADGRCDGDLDSGEESIREMIVRAKERTLSIVTSRMTAFRGPRKACNCGRRSSC